MSLNTISSSFALLLVGQTLFAQELYVFSEPASNMPAKSISAKATAKFPVDGVKSGLQRYTPELMFGLNRNWMIHGSGNFSNFYQRGIRAEGGKVYVKYRFLSNDDVHRHFRMAAFGAAAYSANPYRYEEMNLNGDNSGFEAGLIATQLIDRVAFSGTAGVMKVFPRGHHVPGNMTALNYSISAGYLVLPKASTSFNQPNLNVYLEAMGMKNIGRGGYVLDLAPALQLILGSNLKLNAGYRFQVAGDMTRIAERAWYFSVERTFLGAMRRK